MAACSRELPSPLFSSPMATQPMPASWRCLAISGNGRVSPSSGSFPVPASPGEGVDRAEEEVAGDVLEVAAVLEPRAGRRDVVGGALALGLEQDRQLDVVLAVPRLEGVEQLEAVALGWTTTSTPEPSAGGGLEGLLAGVEAGVGEGLADGRVEAHLLAGVVGERVGARVEVERAGQRQGDDRVGAGDEAQRVGVAVVALREVAVVAVDDRVQLRRVEVGAVPLADARAAGVGEHRAADGLEVGEQAVALDGGADLLGARA